jgi:hypothetical protein
MALATNTEIGPATPAKEFQEKKTCGKPNKDLTMRYTVQFVVIKEVIVEAESPERKELRSQ